MELEQALQKFGLEQFRPGQREVIETIVGGDDCICVMPTGGGKSLCYQLPSIVRSGLTIVVSPLIALMKDQVDALAARGIPAALINSSLSASEQNSRLQAVAAGKYQMVYVAPERLRNNRFIEAIRATPIQLLAIDEAHCISQWGHDFRPDYARIGQFRQLLGGVQTVALTATATPRVRADILEVLGLRKAKQFMSGFARPNLHLGVVQLQNDRAKEEELKEFFASRLGQQGSGIVYAATRKRCDAVVELLSKKLRVSAGAYHAGLLPDQRRAIQERFMNDDLRVVVATNAFGMGIDKPDLRFVIHYNMPGSLEAYYQEAGRAGRDGKDSQCVMLYSFQDRHIQEFFIDNRYPERELIQRVYEFLLEREEDPIELTLEEIRDHLGLSVSPEAVGSCLQILGRTQVLNRLEMGGGLAVVRIDSDLPTLVDMLPREAKVRRSVLRLLERTVGDRRGEDVFVHPRWLQQESKLARDSLNRALRELVRLEPVDYVPPFRGRAVHFRRRDLGFEDLQIDFANLRKRKDAELDRLNQMVRYAQAPLCRQTTILQYFGDTSSDACGRCDRCTRQPGWPKLASTLAAAAPNASAEPGSQSSTDHPASQPTTSTPNRASRQTLEMLEQTVDAIHRLHGRLGKHLLSQYLCGSQNAKVQKLNLHRLSGFGLLKGFRQADAVGLLDALLAAGTLRQKEVNRHRPTVEVAAEWMDMGKRQELLDLVQLPPKLAKALAGLAPTSTPPQPDRVQKPPAADPPKQTPADRSEPAAESPAPHLPPPPRESLSPEPASRPLKPDWTWTLLLFTRGHSWDEVMQIRQMDDEELSTSLCDALRGGGSVQRKWLAADSEQPLSVGRRRVVRELQRRSAAGV